MKCANCDKEYEPDQYWVYCDECGEKVEREWFDNWYLNEDSHWVRKDKDE